MKFEEEPRGFEEDEDRFNNIDEESLNLGYSIEIENSFPTSKNQNMLGNKLMIQVSKLRD